jgi:hypothetical protein
MQIQILNSKTKTRKYKSKTPIVFAIPSEQKKFLKSIPRLALTAFKENKATATDWYNVTFRLKACYEITKIAYENITVEAVKEVLDMLLEVQKRRTSDLDWLMSLEEIETLEIGLDAMDTIEDETTRRIQLDATLISKNYMKQFL